MGDIKHNSRYGLGRRDTVTQFQRRAYVRWKTRHIAGPKRFKLADNEVALVLLGRDIAYFLPVFFAHYRALGIERFVYLDNGSTDNSRELVANEPGTIVARCDLNFRNYQRQLRYIVTRDFLEGGWRLCVDPDELLDYPNAGHISVPDLVSRLAARGHTGVVAQMLEMVPEGSLRAASGLDFAASVTQFNHYSTDNIIKGPYPEGDPVIAPMIRLNTVASPGIDVMTGGLRRSLFGEDCLLTKHVLFRDAGPKVHPFPHPHLTCGLHCSDFTAVLKHYKFAGDYIDREVKRRDEKRLFHKEGQIRLDMLEREGDILFSKVALRQNPTPEGLIDQGFLFASDEARNMLSLNQA